MDQNKGLPTPPTASIADLAKAAEAGIAPPKMDEPEYTFEVRHRDQRGMATVRILTLKEKRQRDRMVAAMMGGYAWESFSPAGREMMHTQAHLYYALRSADGIWRAPPFIAENLDEVTDAELLVRIMLECEKHEQTYFRVSKD